MYGKRLITLFSVLLLVESHPVIALEQAYPDTLAINIGGNYVWDSDTEFSAYSSRGLLGTSINFSRDLSGDEQVATPWIGGYYRFSPHHRVIFSYVRYDRDGEKVLSRDISFGDRTFTVSTSVRSKVESEFLKAAYGWSFYHSKDVELGLSIGAVWVDYSVSLEGLGVTEQKSFDSPVPTLGFRLDYEISPRWHMLFSSDALYIESGDEFRGSLDDSELAVEWRAARNFAVGLGAARTSVDGSIDADDFHGKVTDFYRSGRLYLGARF